MKVESKEEKKEEKIGKTRVIQEDIQERKEGKRDRIFKRKNEKTGKIPLRKDVKTDERIGKNFEKEE